MSEQRATLKDVAERSGYALRTVKNVVAGKSSVGEPVREAVLKAMQELDYKPNFLASTLAKNRSYLIAAVILAGDNEHQQGIRDGIQRFAKQYQDFGLKIELHFTPKQIHAQEIILEEFYERDELDGIILQPVSDTLLSRQINILMYSGKPVVVIDLPPAGCEPVSYVGPDPLQTGRISAQLLGGYLRGCGTVLALSDQASRFRMDAFSKYMLDHCPKVRLQILDTSKPDAMPLEKALANCRPDGIFDCSEDDRNMAWIEQNQKDTDTVVLTNDISAENRERMKKGIIDLMVGAETDEMAYRAASVMFRYLSASELPERKIFSRITIITSECL